MARTVLRVGGFLLAAIGVTALANGFPVDFFHLDSFQKVAASLIVVGVAAQILSFVGARKSSLDDEL